MAEAAGLDGDKARAVLESGAYEERVRQSTLDAQRLGVSGVPAWLLDDRVLVPGAQPHGIFDRVLRELGHSPIEGTA